MTEHYDTIIIGAGLNGLTAAAYLAKAGRKVLVLERRDVVGGMVTTEEVFPGFHIDPVRHTTGWINPAIIRDLNLEKHGLNFLQPDPVLFAPQPDGGFLTFYRDMNRTVETIAQYSQHDAQRWPEFAGMIHRLAGFLADIHDEVPPSGVNLDMGEMLRYGKLGLKLRRMGEKDMVNFIRLMPMSIAELLDDWFESDALKGTLAASGITGVMQGPLAMGTSLVMLHHAIGREVGALRGGMRPRGGSGALALALKTSVESFGGEVRTGAAVSGILIESGQTRGVVLADGEEVAAKAVISSASPYETFIGLASPEKLPPTFVKAICNIRNKSAVAKINLALSGLPDFSAAAGES